jgi:hypothetical protein
MDMETDNHSESAGTAPAAENPNALSGGHVAPQPEESRSDEERIAIQAKRAEQPEPATGNQAGKATESPADSNEMINNTGDDASQAAGDADAASG